MMNEQDELLIARYLDGRADAAEVAALSARIAQDAEFRAALIRAGRLDVSLREILQVRDQKPTLGAGKGGPVIPAAGRFHRRRWWLAAMAAAVLLCALGLWQWSESKTAGVVIAQVELAKDSGAGVRRGSTRLPLTTAMAVYEGDEIDTSGTAEAGAAADSALVTVRFADGTTVALAAGTQARFSEAVGGKRVELDRGASFSAVAKQPAGRPMQFVSRFGQATVVGTKLSFRVGAADARLDVTEGRVELKRTVDGASTMVQSGQYAVATASADQALVTLALAEPPAGNVQFVEDFEGDPVGQAPRCAAGPEKQGWQVVAKDGNQCAEVDATDLAELEIGRKFLSNYHLTCRFQVADPTTSFGIYTPFYGVDESTWGLEVRGTSVYLLAGKTNPTIIGTTGRTPVAQIGPLPAGQWHTLHLRVDAHIMTFEIDGQPVVVEQPNFMQPGLWRFFAKGGRMQFDDLKVEMIPH